MFSSHLVAITVTVYEFFFKFTKIYIIVKFIEINQVQRNPYVWR